MSDGRSPKNLRYSAANANNPLADMRAFNLHNYYIPELSGIDETANTFWLRYAQPVGKWLFRGSLPVSRVPTGNGTSTSGLGDFNAFAAYLFDTGDPAVSFGVGPQLTMPTASEDETRLLAAFAALARSTLTGANSMRETPTTVNRNRPLPTTRYFPGRS